MDDPDTWFDRGVALSEQGDYAGAISAFEKAIAYNQCTVEAWCNRGLVSAQIGKYKQALDSFDQTLQLDPGHANARKAKAMVLALLEKQKSMPGIPVAQQPIRAAPAPAPAPVQGAFTPAAGSSRKAEDIRNPIIAAILSFFFSGWGQWYNGDRYRGLAFFMATFIVAIINFALMIVLKFNQIVYAVFLLVSLGITVYGMYDAYSIAGKINRREIPFARKSRLFWLPVVLLVAMIVILIVAFVFAFLFIAAAAGAHGPGGSSSAYSASHHTKIVAATANQFSADTIVVAYQGGPDNDLVSRVDATVTESSGKAQTKSLSPPNSTAPIAPGTLLTFTGAYKGKDHVVATATFTDGTSQVILDNFI